MILSPVVGIMWLVTLSDGHDALEQRLAHGLLESKNESTNLIILLQ